MSKRILIVDDEESVAFFLGENLAELGAGYRVETACSGEEALAKMAAQSFDLVVTDLRMPGMNGLELIERARARHPHTRLILMTAYGSTGVEAAAYRLGACRYISKPFKIEGLSSAIRSALAEAKTPGRNILVLADEQFDAIAQCLADLQFEVGAQCILLADVAGQMLAHVGQTEGLDLPPLLSLISGGFATAFEMARYLGESQALTLNYHEGQHYDVYSSNVNKELFVVLMFDKRQQRSRIGMVWLYARRALQQLQKLVLATDQPETGQVLDDDFGPLLSDSLDQLLTLDGAGATGAGREAGLENKSDDGERISLWEANELLRSQPSQPQSQGSPPAAAGGATFSLEQALDMGLLDLSWSGAADGSA